MGRLTHIGQMKQGNRCHVPSLWVPGGGAGRREVNRGSGARRAAGRESWAAGSRQRELLCVFHCLLCIFSSSLLLLLVFSLFAVLFNCPYLDPRVLSFSFHSPPHPIGEGRESDHVALCCWPLPKPQRLIGTQGGTRIMSSVCKSNFVIFCYDLLYTFVVLVK